MDNGFNRACPSGNTMVDLSGGEPDRNYADGCGFCGCDIKHKCVCCGNYISVETCDKNGGNCDECQKDIDNE